MKLNTGPVGMLDLIGDISKNVPDKIIEQKPFIPLADNKGIIIKDKSWDDILGPKTEQVSSQVPNISNTPQHVKEKSEQRIDPEKPFQFITGPAGSGKTYQINKLTAENPNLILLGATTGIAAINCNTRTIHSILKYFNTKSLYYSFQDGHLQHVLRKLRETYKMLGIDEISMLSAAQLDLIVDAIVEINQDANPKKLGLLLSGDLCQLPVVSKKEAPEKMVTKADCWDLFDSNTIKLDKIWRQNDSRFIDAVNAVRSGDGKKAVRMLKECGVKFIPDLIMNFEGTTIIPNNIDVDNFNEYRLKQLKTEMIRTMPIRRGEQLGEWKNNIPMEMRFKRDAYIMILSNDHENWEYVNGDCGHVIDYKNENNDEYFVIKLKRTNKTVEIRKILRKNMRNEPPSFSNASGSFRPYSDFQTGQWVIGEIVYFPLRLAWATTVHKSQGLSLDMVQLDSRPQFFGYEGMSYVAISRARTPEGLIIVGTEEGLARKIRTREDMRKYV